MPSYCRQLTFAMSQFFDTYCKVIDHLYGRLPLNDQITVVNRGE